MTLSLQVYDPTNTTLIGTITAGQWREAKHMDAASALGMGGPIGIPHLLDGNVANPALALIQTGRKVRFLHAGICRFVMCVENTAVTVVAPADAKRGEEAEEVTVVTGAGILADTAKVVVRPDRGTGRYPWHPTRWLNFSADRLRDDDPAGPQGAWPFSFGQLPNYDTDNYFGRPAGFVDTAGPAGTGPHWLWNADTRTTNAAGGVCWFRQRFTIASTQDVIVELAADDQGELWIDNVPVCRVEGVYKGGAVRSSVRLSAGEHLIGAWGENLNALRAGVVWAVWSVSDGQPDVLLARSDASTARVLGYPARPPGFTPTELIRLLVSEAQALIPARLGHVTFSFISASDTDHQAVSEVTDLAVKGPATVWTALEMLAASYLDIGVDYSKNGLAMDAWVRGTRGVDRSAYVKFAKGSCRRVQWDIGGAERATVAVVHGKNFAPFVVTHADAAATGVYEEIPLDFGDASRTAATDYATDVLDIVSKARKSVTLEILATPEKATAVTQAGTAVTQAGTAVTVGAQVSPRPYDDFQIGDLVTIPGSDGAPAVHRVAAIGCTVGPDSIKRWEIDLEHPRAVLEERLDALMRRQMPGGLGGRTILTERTDPSFPTNTEGREQTETWSSPATGTVVLTKNGVAIPGASLAASGRKTLTDAARRYVANSDKISFTVGGVDGFPEGWRPPSGRWLLAFAVTQGANGTTITVSYA